MVLIQHHGRAEVSSQIIKIKKGQTIASVIFLFCFWKPSLGPLNRVIGRRRFVHVSASITHGPLNLFISDMHQNNNNVHVILLGT